VVEGIENMRTNIEIDDELMAEVMARTGAKTKRQAVDEALRSKAIQLRQAELRRFKGAISAWDGDLDAMRTDA
jgi:Arc/MetJ family transcription regulator